MPESIAARSIGRNWVRGTAIRSLGCPSPAADVQYGVPALENPNMWHCSSCGESVQDSFQVCWNCCTNRDGTSSDDFKREPVASDNDALKPPIFLWRSGTLDAFETVEELVQQFSAANLAGDDFIACDSVGRILLAGRGSDGSAVLACDVQQPPSPDVLRDIFARYLGRKGMSAGELECLPLADLVRRAYLPPDPSLGETKYDVLKHAVLKKLLFLAAAVLAPLLFRLLKWLTR